MKTKNWADLKTFLTLWITQTFSSLGSSMTSYALVIWSYTQHGSALATALLMVCSYAPYVILSLFAGALSDRWNKKKTLLICDACAAVTTLCVLWLYHSQSLQIWHLYVLNALGGVMNSVQQPASEVATTAVLPKEHYQKVGGLRYFGSACTSILTPVLATAFLGLAGLEMVIWFDLFTFAVAFGILLVRIRIPEPPREEKEAFWPSVKGGLSYLKANRGIFDLMLFLAAINLVASMYNAALPAMLLSRNGGSERALGTVNAVTGISMLIGSIVASLMKTPKSRVQVICNTLLISMSTENALLAFGHSLPVWCVGGFLGWVVIPTMNANLDALMRLHIPVEIQGRVFAARNSFQFFTIPLGYVLGGWAVDSVFEPLMARMGDGDLLTRLFGSGKGSGAACFFALLAGMGVLVCLLFRKDPHIWRLEENRDVSVSK